MKNDDLEWLVARYLDGVASPQEKERLDEEVRRHPDAARELVRVAMLDMAVRSLVEESAAAAEFVRKGVGKEERRASPWKYIWIPLAAAASVAIAAGVWRFGHEHRPAGLEPMVAEVVGKGTVVTIQGTVVRAGQAVGLKVGDILAPGDRVSTGPDGYLKYAYLDGSVVGLGPNSTFSLLRKARSAAKAVQLWAGLLDATIRRQPADALMTFVTPHGSATVMGTILRVNATQKDSEVGVYSGQVEVTAKKKRVMVNSGEVAVADGDGLNKHEEPEYLPAVDNVAYEDGAILFQDSFERGLQHWNLYTKQGEGDRLRMSEEAGCPDIQTVEIRRNGRLKRVAELTGREPAGHRVAISTKPLAWSYREGLAFSLAYEYSYEGATRQAMDGINIDVNWEHNFPPFFNGTFTQKARPAGEWNQVKWVCVPKTDRRGRPVVDSRLYLNGEFLARRWEYGWWDGAGVGLILEVPEGTLLFDNVVIREMRKEDGER